MFRYLLKPTLAFSLAVAAIPSHAGVVMESTLECKLSHVNANPKALADAEARMGVDLSGLKKGAEMHLQADIRHPDEGGTDMLLQALLIEPHTHKDDMNLWVGGKTHSVLSHIVPKETLFSTAQLAIGTQNFLGDRVTYGDRRVAFGRHGGRIDVKRLSYRVQDRRWGGVMSLPSDLGLVQATLDCEEAMDTPAALSAHLRLLERAMDSSTQL